MHSCQHLSLSPTAELYKSRFRQDHIQDSHRRIGLETSVRTPEHTKRYGAHTPKSTFGICPGYARIRADPRLERSRMKDVFEFLDYARSLVHEVLPRLTTEQRSQTFRPKKWSDSRWPWTATKVLHRLVGHEGQHTHYLQRTLRVHDNH